MSCCSVHSYFEADSAAHQTDTGESDEVVDSEEKGGISKLAKINVLQQLLSYFKDLAGRCDLFQDELLLSCTDLLLKVPIALLFNKEMQTDNIEMWKVIMMKALDLGHSNNQIAMTCVEMLDKWFSSLPPGITAKLYKQLLPKLSDYLNVENDATAGPDQFYHQRVLAKERDIGRRKVSRRDISKRVLALLGQIGGYAHHIISNEESRRRERENFIRWDSEKRLKFTLPLYNKKIDIYLDACLPRVVDLAQNSARKDVRIAACEFLHSLIIYMIGKNAQKSDVGNKKKDDRKKKDEIDEE